MSYLFQNSFLESANDNNNNNNNNIHCVKNNYKKVTNDSQYTVNGNLNFHYFIVFIFILITISQTWCITIPKCGVELFPIEGDNTICYGDSVFLTINSNISSKLILKQFSNYTSNPFSTLTGKLIDYTYSPIDTFFTFPSSQQTYFIYAYDNITQCQISILPINQNGGGDICVPQFVGNSPILDGDLDDSLYTHITEFPFAAPITGSDHFNSDSSGEFSNGNVFDITSNSSISIDNNNNTNSSSDIQQFYITYDDSYLYFFIKGVDMCNDGNDLFIAIDVNNSIGYSEVVMATEAPWNKHVDFAGWRPDFFVVIDRINTNNDSNDYAAIYQTGSTEELAVENNTNNISQEISFEVVGRCGGEIEVRVPFILIGGIPPPQTGKMMNFAIYTTFDEDNFDVFDSAPSVSNGQIFEEMGDSPYDSDRCSGIGGMIDPAMRSHDSCDSSPFSDDSNGGGVNQSQFASDNSITDIDTIESYFQIRNIGQLTIPPLNIELPPIQVYTTLPANLTIYQPFEPPTLGYCNSGIQLYTWYIGSSDSPNYSSPVNDTSSSLIGLNYYWLEFSNGCFKVNTMMEVRAINPPLASNDTTSTSENLSIFIYPLLNDYYYYQQQTYPNYGSIFIRDITQPQNGNSSFLGEGNSLEYTPSPHFFGTDYFDYTISDGVLNSTARITITVSNIEDPPIAQNDYVYAISGSQITIFPLLNDTDYDGSDTISILNNDNPNNGFANKTSNNTITYISNIGFTGLDFINYTITDSIYLSSAVIQINVLASNSPPIAFDDIEVIDEDNTTVFTPLRNDSSGRSPPVFINNITKPNHGNATILEGNTEIEYTPDFDYNGNDFIVYTITDGISFASASINITINPIDDAPFAVADNYNVTDNSITVFSPLDNDYDIDSPNSSFYIYNISQPIYGNASFTPTTITFNSLANYNVIDQFIYIIASYTPNNKTFIENQSIATIFVNISHLPLPPTPLSFNSNFEEDETRLIFINEYVNNFDEFYFYIDSVSDPSFGTISFDRNIIRYTPFPDYNGFDQLIYTIKSPDYSTNYTASAFINITIRGINDPPIAVDDYYPIFVNSNLTFNPLENDLDYDYDPLFITSITQAINGNLILPTDNFPFYIYIPKENFIGVEILYYTISDDYYSLTREIGSTFASIVINVTELVFPIAEDDFANTTKNNPIFIFPLSNDHFSNETFSSSPRSSSSSLFIISVTNGTHGSAEIIFDQSNDRILYTPDQDFIGYDIFVYTISDGSQDLFSTAFITVIIYDDINAEDDHVITIQNEPIEIFPLDNDEIELSTEIILTFLSGPSNGNSSVISLYSIKYFPNLDFFGKDEIRYSIANQFNSSSASIFIDVKKEKVEVDLDLGSDGFNFNVNFKLNEEKMVPIVGDLSIFVFETNFISECFVQIKNAFDGENEILFATIDHSIPNEGPIGRDGYSDFPSPPYSQYSPYTQYPSSSSLTQSFDRNQYKLTIKGEGSIEEYIKILKTTSYVNLAQNITKISRKISFICIDQLENQNNAAISIISFVEENQKPIVDLDQNRSSFDYETEFNYTSHSVLVCPQVEISDFDSSFLIGCFAWLKDTAEDKNNNLIGDYLFLNTSLPSISSFFISSPYYYYFPQNSIYFDEYYLENYNNGEGYNYNYYNYYGYNNEENNYENKYYNYEYNYNLIGREKREEGGEGGEGEGEWRFDINSKILSITGKMEIWKYNLILSSIIYQNEGKIPKNPREICIFCTDDQNEESDPHSSFIHFPPLPSPPSSDCPFLCFMVKGNGKRVCVEEEMDCVSYLPLDYYSSLSFLQSCCSSCVGVVPFITRISSNSEISIKGLNGEIIGNITTTIAPGSNYFIQINNPISIDEDLCDKKATSPVVDITLLDENYSPIENPSFVVPITLSFYSYLHPNDASDWKKQRIAFINEENEYEGLDTSVTLIPITSTEYIVTSETTHFTNFAVLIMGTNDDDEDEEFESDLSWLSFASVLFAIIVVIIAVIINEIYLRWKHYKSDRRMDLLLNRVNNLSSQPPSNLSPPRTI